MRLKTCSATHKELVYLGLGSNIGNRIAIIEKAILAISKLPGVELLKASRLFVTTPVSDIPQSDYVNAACKLQTSLSAEELFKKLQKIELELGKQQKAKNAPRVIDIDILFFGNTYCETAGLQIPHPRWKERLFVLMPLSDVAKEITYPINDQGLTETLSLKKWIAAFNNPHQEKVIPLSEPRFRT
jgi:2-amino-4-hydroxy-6-hydroxymethyldihydropteridine diphosphokinase